MTKKVKINQKFSIIMRVMKRILPSVRSQEALRTRIHSGCGEVLDNFNSLSTRICFLVEKNKTFVARVVSRFDVEAALRRLLVT